MSTLREYHNALARLKDALKCFVPSSIVNLVFFCLNKILLFCIEYRKVVTTIKTKIKRAIKSRPTMSSIETLSNVQGPNKLQRLGNEVSAGQYFPSGHVYISVGVGQ